MGELWALPIFLRYGLIEFLAQALVFAIRPSTPPTLPVAGSPLPEAGDPSAAEEAANNDSVANIILSLRTISEQNWNDFFEAVSCLEQTLRGDPAGIYPQMTFKTRDLYRKEIEALSFSTGRDEYEVAGIILDLALALQNCCAGSVGWQISPTGRARCDARPPISVSTCSVKAGLCLNSGLATSRTQNPHSNVGCYRHASAFYLSNILLLTVLIFIALAFAILPVPTIAIFLLAVVLLIPALTVATSLVNWVITLVVPPRILPKLNFKDGIPDAFQTLVVIPALITSHEEIDSLVHQLELHYLRNPEPGLLFALLTDFRDADSETLPEDEDLVQYATAAIEALNIQLRYSCFRESIRGCRRGWTACQRASPGRR